MCLGCQAGSPQDVPHAARGVGPASPPGAKMRGDSHILHHGHLAERPDDLVRPHDSTLHDRMIRKAFNAFASEPDLAGSRLDRADQA